MRVLWFWDSENNWWRGQRVEGAPKCNYRTHQCEINLGLDSCNTIIGLKSRYTSNIYKIPRPGHHRDGEATGEQGAHSWE